MIGTKKSLSTAMLWAVGLLVVILPWLSSYVYFSVCRPDLSWSEKGSIGDSFGAVSALFSGLAFLAVIITIYLQSKALQSQAHVRLKAISTWSGYLYH